MTVKHIICLLEFCLKNTYFEPIDGAAMGSPIGPIIANLYIDAFEKQAINTATHPPSVWKRFVDDTFMVIKKAQKDSFIEDIKSIDEKIQFTMEDCRHDGSMPFLNTLVTPRSVGSLSTTLYKKPHHTDLYLQWNNHHILAAKYSVINTLHHRATAVCSN